MEDKKTLKERLTEEEIEFLNNLILDAARSMEKLEQQIAKEREKELTTEELIEQAKGANSLGKKLKNNVKFEDVADKQKRKWFLHFLFLI